MKWYRLILLLILCFPAQRGWGQTPPVPSPSVSQQSKDLEMKRETIVVPQLRALTVQNESRDRAEAFGRQRTDAYFESKWAVTPGGGNRQLVVPSVSAEVKIQNDLADTKLEFQCVNPGTRDVNAPIAVPLPENYEVAKDKSAPTGELMPTQEALPVWKSLAKGLADPAPIEFCGSPLLKTNPINLPAGKSRTVTIQYGQTLSKTGKRYDYILPRSESVQNTVPWKFKADVQCDQPISTVFCPSHKVKAKRRSANSFQIELDEGQTAQPGSIRLSYLCDQGSGLSATLFTQPEELTPNSGGTFLFLAGGPAVTPAGGAIPRELTLALDRSGSMQGQKIEHVKQAATEVIQRLNEGESFNIITYNDRIDAFADEPVRKTEKSLGEALKFIQDVRPRGGTNLHGALLESVRQKPVPNTLPIVLFLTDGLPTVGETAEVKIRDVIANQNKYNRRVFTVGVGVDVNTPLLENIADETRAQPSFVLPKDNVRTKLSQIFERLERPILADARLEILNADGSSAAKRVSDIYPTALPDLFQDGHLIVLGRFQGTEPLTFRVSGNLLGSQKTVDFPFAISGQPAVPFVARLWATQKIAALVQEIRNSGANTDPYVILTNPKQDPELKKKAEEVLKLTRRYGILTEYTAFLANDEQSWSNRREQLDMAYRNFDERAVKTRVGLSSVNQSINNSGLQRNYFLNGTNSFWDEKMRRVTVPNVQQLESRAFFRRGNVWVDGRLVDRQNLTPSQIVPFGSPDYDKLVTRLVETGEHTPLSLGHNVLIEIDNKPVLIHSTTNTASPAPTQPTEAAKQVPKR